MAEYGADSLYATTSKNQNYLDILDFREIPSEADDAYYTLTQIHENRPDLLAYDLYNNANLWWVFAARHPNTIKDPIFDFIAGIQFFIPKKSNIEQALGL